MMERDARVPSHALKTELTSLLNRHSRENASDTPDWVLANYLLGCLEVYERAIRLRARFAGDPKACSDEEWENS